MYHPSFVNLGKLKKLRLSGNEFVNFPLTVDILEAFRNTEIDLGGNESLRSPPQHVIKSVESLRAYMEDLRAGAGPCGHLQVFIVGDGGVGKTTLCRTAMLGKQPFFKGRFVGLESV